MAHVPNYSSISASGLCILLLLFCFSSYPFGVQTSDRINASHGYLCAMSHIYSDFGAPLSLANVLSYWALFKARCDLVTPKAHDMNHTPYTGLFTTNDLKLR